MIKLLLAAIALLSITYLLIFSNHQSQPLLEQSFKNNKPFRINKWQTDLVFTRVSQHDDHDIVKLAKKSETLTQYQKFYLERNPHYNNQFKFITYDDYGMKKVLAASANHNDNNLYLYNNIGPDSDYFNLYWTINEFYNAYQIQSVDPYRNNDWICNDQLVSSEEKQFIVNDCDFTPLYINIY